MEFDDLDKSLSDMRTMRVEKTVLGQVDRYEIVKKLGEGGFGAVYGANDLESGIYVALKSLPAEIVADQEEMEDIRSNFQLISKLHHPVIASVLHLHRVVNVDSGTAKNLGIKVDDYLVVMEYAPGSTLFSYVRSKKDKILELDDALKICRPIAEALDYAHSMKILHRDIKPKNIMVSNTEQNSIKILDFGLAAEIKSSMSRKSSDASSSTSGTPLYMAPEQWAGKRQSGTADQYALAAILYELVVGEVPFKSVCDSGNLELIRNVVLNDEIEPIESLTKHQNFVLKKALSKKPDDRFKSCVKFIEEFNNKKIKSLNRKLLISISLLSVILILIVGLLIANYFRKKSPILEPVTENAVNRLKSEMVAAVGICAFDVSPVGSEVKIYGMRGLIHEGVSPLNVQLNYGDYDVVVSKRGYTKVEEAVRINSDKTIEIVLAPLRGDLTINTVPNANIVVVDEDGMTINLGKSSAEGLLVYNRLIEGNYSVIVNALNYSEETVETYISQNRKVELDIMPLGLPGSLRVLAEENFDIFIDGKKIGRSNQKINGIPAGTQNFEFIKIDHKPVYEEFFIPPNQEYIFQEKIVFEKLNGSVCLALLPTEGVNFPNEIIFSNFISLWADSEPRIRINGKEWTFLSPNDRELVATLDIGEHFYELDFSNNFLSESGKFRINSKEETLIELKPKLKNRQVAIVGEYSDIDITLYWSDYNGESFEEKIFSYDGAELQRPGFLREVLVEKAGYFDKRINLDSGFNKIREGIEDIEYTLSPSTVLNILPPKIIGVKADLSQAYLNKLTCSYSFKFLNDEILQSKDSFVNSRASLPVRKYFEQGLLSIRCVIKDSASNEIFRDDKSVEIGPMGATVNFEFKPSPAYLTVNVDGEAGKAFITQNGRTEEIKVGRRTEVLPLSPIEIQVGDEKFSVASLQPGKISEKLIKIKQNVIRPRVH